MKNGILKHLLKNASSGKVPEAIRERQDKMGFPVPLHSWIGGELKSFFEDHFRSDAFPEHIFDREKALAALSSERPFARNLWAVLSLTLWRKVFFHQKRFLDAV